MLACASAGDLVLAGPLRLTLISLLFVQPFMVIACSCLVQYHSTLAYMTSENSASTYDVVVIGGAFSGAAWATPSLRTTPGARPLRLRKSVRCSGRAGAATAQ